MGVIQATPDSFTPICNDCGICLCFDISAHEYNEIKQFWDDWECGGCNLNAKGSRKKYKADQVHQEGK